MHTITVSIQGDVNVSESLEVDDAEALPLFIRMKAILKPSDAAIPAKRRGRPRRERFAEEMLPQADQSEAAPETTEA